VDLATGARSDISSPAVGTGIALDGPQSVALDSANNRALVIATIDSVVIAVDLATGNRTELSGQTAGTGPALTDLRDIEIDGANNRALVVDADAIVAIDLSTGNRTSISDAATGSGPALSSPESISLDSANNRLFVAHLGGSLLSVDLATGDRTLVAETDTDYGLNGTRFTGVAYDAGNGRALVTDSQVDAIFAFDLPGGSRSVAFDSSTGTGLARLNLYGVNGIALDGQGKRVLVSHGNAKALVAASIEDGSRTLLSSDGSQTPAKGTGPAVDFPQKLAMDGTNNRVLIIDQNLGGILSVDLTSGDRAVVSANGGTGTGPAFSSPKDIVLDLVNNRVLVTDSGAGLLAVDLTSGDRTTISDSVTGSGPVFGQPASLALDADNNRALVLDWDIDMLLAVDLSTGDRTVISDNTGTGSGANFSVPFDMELDSANNRVIATDYGGGAYKLMAISLANGDRTELSGATTGSGVLFRNPYYVVLDSGNNRAFVYDIAVTGIIEVELSNGERAVMSK
jgi:DNA-binding beta-propeller fold protein YncE